MSKKKPLYEHYFKVGQQVKISLSRSENTYRECNGELLLIQDDRCRIELLGEGVPAEFQRKGAVTKVAFSGWSGWSFFRCDASVEEVFSQKEIGLLLEGPVDEKQRREYFRLDVFLPISLSVPEEQFMSALETQWKARSAEHRNGPPPEMLPSARGYRTVTAAGEDLMPQNVNLSGGGLRYRRASFIPPGTKVNVDLFLPLAPARVIPTVAEVLRCNEIKLSLDRDPNFITAMKFIFIEEKDREAIIAYVFAEQRNQLQSDAERNAPFPRSPDSR